MNPIRVSPSSATRRRRPHPRTLEVGALAIGFALVVAACGTSAASATPSGSAARSASPTASASPTVSVASSSTASSPPSPASTSTGSTTALALQQALVDVVKKVNPSVVVIQTDSGLGSGIVFDAKGDIVTNAHVTDGSTTFKVTLADGRTFDGTLVGSFKGDDVAVVHVEATGLMPATFGDSTKLAVGDIVMALGNPLGLQSSVTEGIVSALGRTVSEENGIALANTIQTSAPINPGNSGGALVDLSGAVVGIPTLAATDPQLGGAATGIGFAISSNMATDIAQQLIDNGKVVESHRAYLGVTTVDALGAPGAVVYAVAAGGPADTAGIARGEAITSIDGKATPDSATLAEVLAGLAPGQAVKVDLARSTGETSTVTVTLGELPG